MLVFLSWSGPQSKSVAETLAAWIGQVIQAAEPWVSLDIDKGARWSPEISQKLEASKVGIICLTKENLDAQWILFEAGALSKTKEAHVCTFLLGLDPSDVQQPLGQFQHTSFEKSDIRRLVGTINRLVQSGGEKSLQEKVLDEIFETYWPRLNETLTGIAKSEAPAKKKERPEREMLQEILELLRAQERRRSILERQEEVGRSVLSKYLEREFFAKPSDIARSGIRTLLTADDDDIVRAVRKRIKDDDGPTDPTA